MGQLLFRSDDLFHFIAGFREFDHGQFFNRLHLHGRMDMFLQSFFEGEKFRRDELSG
jgi:hypothetical protein